jgi:PAS domain-containing protein
MQDFMIMEWVALAAICMTTAVLSVSLLSSRTRTKPFGPSSSSETVWIFDGSELLDATSAASTIIGQPEGPNDWSDLHAQLISAFPGFPSSPSLVKASGQIVTRGSEPRETMEIVFEWIDGITRVQLREQPIAGSKSISRHDRSDTEELETLRVAMNNSYYPVWRVDQDGSVTWYNSAYENLCMTVHKKKPGAGIGLFTSQNESPIPTKRARRSLTVPETGQKLWFDVSVVQTDAGTLCYAVNVNAVVEAEAAQRSFVQTLAKTFAQLSTGLAIFDRNRQLVLFNPALIDLTALPADFLSARPTLLSFFDRLRDQKMMPEPKNYGSWRDQMADLVEAAANGRYQETWSLPSGSVYSVSGRPHPDGAVAFLIEDITAEITLTRRFRSDLELGQSIFDKLDDAIAVFSIEGTLTFSNSAYQKLWNVDPEKSFAQTAILDAIRVWQEKCMATPVWGDIRDFVVTQENRAEWWAKVTLRSGEVLICSIHPIHSGSTMINFSRTAVTAKTAPEITLELSAD